MSGLSSGQIPREAFMPPIFFWLGLGPGQKRPEPPVPSETAIEKLKRIDCELGILSLSTTADNLLLWAHYADQHRGLAVEIDITHPGFNAHNGGDKRFQLAKAVTYSDQRPRIPETDEILFEHFFVKSREWAYEQEFRIVRKLASSSEQMEATDSPFPVHLFALPPATIRRVIFGARAKPSDRAGLMRAVRGKLDLSDVAFAEAVLDPGRFRMEIQEIREPE
ncbi:MAG: DUF2971 domain-containing protein [Acetobacteraceae bacterium]|nr:DUF2971 domain-containing protein [Acetobacteraceae bacterium]